jgi:hypothetical protein
MKNLGQLSQWPGQDCNQAPPEQKSEALPTSVSMHIYCSINHYKYTNLTKEQWILICKN